MTRHGTATFAGIVLENLERLMRPSEAHWFGHVGPSEELQIAVGK